ncbi:tol-pal system protein YbgF [uncultured Thiodictyon sp.]|uniref:tol-pal system protein YbgF n=1 Tax=uncultured Thiodictyon sp. TaxID=1846217 RepID=UPI0025D5A8A5|nr:tol-pal system protein YbgF [uncultured Thiodictyon sp.]
MNNARSTLLLIAALGAATALPTSASAAGYAAANPLLEDRVARIERIMENQSAAGQQLQMQQFQQEMQELRGLVETQQFEIQKLQRQLRDQYLDIDSRLGTGKGLDAPAGQSPAAPGTDNGTDSGPGGAAPPASPNGAIDASGRDLKPPVGNETPPPVTAPIPSSPGAVGIPSLPSPETTGGNERDAYRDAFELLKQRKYPDAVTAFNDLLRRYPQGQYADNARYWLAETYYAQHNYPAALAEFDRLVQLNPGSTRLAAALLKIGDIQSEQDAREQARNAYRQVIAKYPGTPEARLAQSRLQKLGPERKEPTSYAPSIPHTSATPRRNP